MSKEHTNDEFNYESMQDSRSIVKYLEAVAQGFDSGRLLFCSGKNELLLKPQGMLQFLLKARRKDGQVKVSLKVSWKEERRSSKEPVELMIQTGEGAQDG